MSGCNVVGRFCFCIDFYGIGYVWNEVFIDWIIWIYVDFNGNVLNDFGEVFGCVLRRKDVEFGFVGG